MSSAAFRKAQKSRQKPHRERSQPASRRHLGLLEKKKDYKLRAEDFHKKRDKLKRLHQLAADKNPDEFYFKMVNSKIKDGVHRTDNNTLLTDDQRKLMKSQDLNYVNLKISAESKKVERLKGRLHSVGVNDVNPMNKHTIFLDTQNEVRNFNAASHFNTPDELMTRTSNRPTMEMLASTSFNPSTSSKKLDKLTAKQYKELVSRQNRCVQLNILSQKLETKKNLIDKNKKRKVKKETKSEPAVYKWDTKRKK